MNARRTTIENIRAELDRLNIASNNIRRAIEELANQEPDVIAGPLDRDGRVIHIGQTVIFLTRGRHASTQGIVHRFSRNQECVFSFDSDGFEMQRAPRNVRIVDDDEQ